MRSALKIKFTYLITCLHTKTVFLTVPKSTNVLLSPLRESNYTLSGLFNYFIHIIII